MSTALQPVVQPSATMKPMRALGAVALAMCLWLSWRMPVLIAEFQAALVAMHRSIVAAPRASLGRVRTGGSDPKPLSTPPLAAMASPPHPALNAVSQAAPSPTGPAITAAAAPATLFGRVAPMVTVLVRLGEAQYLLPVSSRAMRARPARRQSAEAQATSAYSSLTAGDRRDAALGFEDAARSAPDDPRAAVWGREAQRLQRRWSGAAFVFARAAGPPDFASAALLGGGQSGAMLAFTPRPLAARPLALTLRGAVAHDGLGIDGASAQGAFGARWQLARGLALSGEWLVASGDGAASGWTLRLAGGASGTRGRFEWSGYGEAGIVNANPYAAGQGFVGWRLPVRGVDLVAGGGAWGGAQHDGTTVDRLDLGPSLRLRWAGAALPVELSADYRFRVAGNAQPGSGVAVTLATYF